MSNFTINTHIACSILTVNGLVNLIQLIINNIVQAQVTEQIRDDSRLR